MNIKEEFMNFISLYDDGKYYRLFKYKTNSDDSRVEIDFLDIEDYSSELADYISKTSNIDSWFKVMASTIMNECGNPEIMATISIINLPEAMNISLRKIDFSNIGKLIQIKGVILRASSPEQVLIETTYRCSTSDCSREVVIPQNQRWIVKPTICSECGNRVWNLITRKSKYRTRQIINLFESWDEGGKDSPFGVNIFLWDDLVNTVSPGDRVYIVGIPDVREIEKNDPETKMELYITANSIIQTNRENEGDHFTEDEINEFKERVESKTFLNDLSSCISPSIHGNEMVKKAIILQLAGGVEKKIGSDEKRGITHLLLTGDAGTGKTTLIKSAASLSSRGIFTTGMGITKAGLTASATKEGEKWVLDAGAMVLANGGLIAVDEFDKMHADDRGAMHTAMENGICPINKAGINTILKAKTSVLAACNPKLGRYNTNETLLKNLSGFPETLLSRFDAIFLFLDEGDNKIDLERAIYVDKIMRGSSATQQKFTEKWVRRFIAYSKMINPKIPEPVGKRIIDYYMGMRQAGRQAGKSVAITQRQQEALYRFTEASARIHLREEAILEDAENAISIIGFSLKQVGIDPETGNYDVDAMYFGIPRTLQDKLRKLPHLVDKIQKSNVTSGTCSITDLRNALTIEWKISYFDADSIIQTAMKDGILFNPRSGEIQSVI